MKRVLVNAVLAVFLCSLLIGLFGCRFDQQGETVAEGHRRHLRVMRITQQQMMEDIDSTFFMDEPSGLTNKVMP